MLATFGDDDIAETLTFDECEAVRAELRAIVSSPYFKNSKRYPAFLRYIVEETLRGGRTLEIKERTIGIEVFGRPNDYDTNSDPTVRNTASEVRKRLSLYYAEAPTRPEISIYFPLGSYRPQFCFAAKTAQTHDADPAPAQTEAGLGVDASDNHRQWRLVGISFFALAVLSVCLWSMVAGFKRRSLDRLWAGFMNPAQPVLIVTPRAPGPVVLAGLGQNQADLSNWIKDNPDIAAEDLSAIIQAIKPLTKHDIPYSVRMDSSVTLDDLRDRPIIMIGGPSNAWTMKFLSSLRYHFVIGPPLYIEDTQNPQARKWGYIRGGDSPHSPVVEDSCIIARFHDPTTGGIVMILAGAGRNGTEVAGQFVASPTLLDDLNKHLPSGWKDKNLEVVLKTKVIDGKTGSPSIEATYLW